MSSSQNTPQTSYDPKYFSPLFEAEEKHFWFRSRNEILSRMIKKLTDPLPDRFHLVEVGCGTGNVLRMLEQTCARGSVTGMDLFSDGLQFARQRVQVPLIQGDMTHPPFLGQFDVVCMFDVLEHLPDDIAILKSVSELLVSGGKLLITVPADPGLWSYFDNASHHYRRYTRTDLQQKIQDAGFEVEFISPYMLAIYPIVWLNRHLASLGNKQSQLDEESIEKLSTNELSIIPVVNEILTWILSQEAGWLASGRHLLGGTSLIAVAKKVN
jgi:SAM-dependent methyltransferase